MRSILFGIILSILRATSALAHSLLTGLIKIEALLFTSNEKTARTSLEKDGWTYIKSRSESKLNVDLIEWGKPNRNNDWNSEQITLMKRGEQIVGSGYSTGDKQFSEKLTAELKRMGYVLVDQVKFNDEHLYVFRCRSKNIILTKSVKNITREGMNFQAYAYAFYNSKYFPELDKSFK